MVTHNEPLLRALDRSVSRLRMAHLRGDRRGRSHGVQSVTPESMAASFVITLPMLKVGIERK